MRRQKVWYPIVLIVLLLAAGCGEVRKRPAGQAPSPPPAGEAYPPPEWTPEPTAPPLPTMTPVPTVPTTPTPTRVPGPPKPTPLVTPILPFPTPALSPTPVAEPPPGLQTIWYPHFAAPDGRPMLQAVLVDEQGRRWGELGLAIDLGLEAPGYPGSTTLFALHASPDGRSFVADVNYGEDRRAFWIDPASGESTVVTTDGRHDDFLAWGPDRQVFVRNPNIDPEPGIWLLDLDTQEYQIIDVPSGPGYQAVVAIAVSPDGLILADATAYGPTASHPGTEVEVGLRSFPHGDRSVAAEIYVPPTDADPHGFGSVIEYGLIWSPNGANMALVLTAESEGELWIVDKTTGQATKLVRGLTWYHPAIWSADARYIAFIRAESPTHMRSPANLWLFDLATSTEIQLTHFTDQRVTSVTWSPDGQRLAFAVTVGDYGEVWITSVDGTEQYPVAGPTAPDAPIVWLPAMVQRY